MPFDFYQIFSNYNLKHLKHALPELFFKIAKDYSNKHSNEFTENDYFGFRRSCLLCLL